MVTNIRHLCRNKKTHNIIEIPLTWSALVCRSLRKYDFKKKCIFHSRQSHVINSIAHPFALFSNAIASILYSYQK